MNSSDIDKVLRADLINIVKKVQEGKPLTKRERDLVEYESVKVNGELTVKELAKRLTISKVTYYEWRKDPEAPQNKNLDDWLAYKVKRQTLGKGGGGKYTVIELSDLKGQLLAERMLREKAERKLKEIQLRKEQEGWVSMGEAEEAIKRVLEPLSRLLDTMPKAYAIRVNASDPDQAEDALREAVEDIKRQMTAKRGGNISKRKGIK